MGLKLYRIGMSRQEWKETVRQNGIFSTGLYSFMLKVLNDNNSLKKARRSVVKVLEVAKSKVKERN